MNSQSSRNAWGSMLESHRLNFAAPGPRAVAAPAADAKTARDLHALWEKYAGELAELSGQLADKFRDMNQRKFGATFGDLEGELLYVLVREGRPEIVYEISPNSGYSTNYLLAAVTRNGVGRVESFELIDSFDGVPTAEVIRGNLIGLCDPGRHRLTIGDARVEALRGLERGVPSFTLIDSCHDDFFAEFYVKALLPRLTGTVVVQDIFHFDPRPEWATEASYLLSFLYETATPFLPFPLYEDGLAAAPARAGLAARRPLRSNSILFTLGDRPATADPADGERLIALIEDQRRGAPARLDPVFPLNAALDAPALLSGFRDRDRPADRYVAAVHGQALDEDAPGFAEVVTLAQGRGALTPRLLNGLTAAFNRMDPCLQTLTVEALVHFRQAETARALIARVGPLRGAELPQRLAYAAARLGLADATYAWIEACRRGAADRTLAVGFRPLLRCTEIALAIGAADLADRLFEEALALRAHRTALFGDGPGTKIYREIEEFCRRVPRFAGRGGA